MAETLNVSERTIQRLINDMPEISFTGGGRSGHWEIDEQWFDLEVTNYVANQVGDQDTCNVSKMSIKNLKKPWTCWNNRNIYIRYTVLQIIKTQDIDVTIEMEQSECQIFVC